MYDLFGYLQNDVDELLCIRVLEGQILDARPAGMNDGQFLEFLLPVVMNESFKMETRHLAIECLLRIAEAQHDLPQYIWEGLLRVLMHKLLDINDDGVPGEFFDVGEFGLGRLASALDGEMIFDYMYGLVVEYLDDAQDWKRRFSGLKCIAQMADGCSEVLVDDRLDSIFALVLNAFVDPNACVQRAAFDSVGYLASALDGEMIFNYMYGLVVEYLDDAHDWRNRFSGLKCIAQMADGCSEVLVDDRLDSIFYLVLNAFVDDNACVQRAAFDSVRYLAKYLSPNFQNRNAGRVLKGLLGVIMASHRDPELKADAVQAMRDFFKTCNEDIKKRYRNDMADKLSYFHVTL